MITNTSPNQQLTDIEKNFGTYIDPLTDFGFKKLFGQEDSKEFLISFLNSLLSRYGASEISDLTYQNTKALGTIELDRKVVYDIYCTTIEGSNFVVELQKGYQRYYKNRSLCYSCRAITEQMKKGSEYKFELNKVFVVSILNFSIPEHINKPVNQYLHSVSLRDDDHPDEVAFDNLKFIFIELPKFNKEITKATSIIDKWISLLKDLAHFNDLSENNFAYIDEFWTRFFHRAKIKNLETVELEDYQRSVKYSNEIKEVRDAAYNLLEQEKEKVEQEKEKVEQEKEKVEQELALTQQREKILAKQLKETAIIGIRNLLEFSVPIESILKKYPNFTELEILMLQNQ